MFLKFCLKPSFGEKLRFVMVNDIKKLFHLKEELDLGAKESHHSGMINLLGSVL